MCKLLGTRGRGIVGVSQQPCGNRVYMQHKGAHMQVRLTDCSRGSGAWTHTWAGGRRSMRPCAMALALLARALPSLSAPKTRCRGAQRADWKVDAWRLHASGWNHESIEISAGPPRL